MRLHTKTASIFEETAADKVHMKHNSSTSGQGELYYSGKKVQLFAKYKENPVFS